LVAKKQQGGKVKAGGRIQTREERVRLGRKKSDRGRKNQIGEEKVRPG
jgi:hypothetical protein